VICGEKFVRTTMWKFNVKRRHALERLIVRYACHGCTSNSYNDAVSELDRYYRAMELSRLRGRSHEY
jgi:hypothetical protein